MARVSSGVFVDTQFWLALALPADEFHARAVEWMRVNARARLVTSDEVFVEFLGRMAGKGARVRAVAETCVRGAMTLPQLTVIPFSRERFVAALDLFRDRPDKGYSLMDCASMVLMRQRGVGRVLTEDHHFVQEGFELAYG